MFDAPNSLIYVFCRVHPQELTIRYIYKRKNIKKAASLFQKNLTAPSRVTDLRRVIKLESLLGDEMMDIKGLESCETVVW